MIPGTGTLVNVITVLAGTTVGVLVGHRLPERTRTVVTDGLGLVTLLIAGTSAAHVTDTELSDAVGSAAPMLIVLGSVLVGGIVGSLLRIEDRLEDFGGSLQRAAVRRFGAIGRRRGTRALRPGVRRQLAGVLRRPAHDPRLDQRGPGQRRRSTTAQGGARRVRRDRLRGVLRLGRGGERDRAGHHPGQPDRPRPGPRQLRAGRPPQCVDRHRRVCCSSGWPSGCSTSSRSRSLTCSRHCWSLPC